MSYSLELTIQTHDRANLINTSKVINTMHISIGFFFIIFSIIWLPSNTHTHPPNNSLLSFNSYQLASLRASTCFLQDTICKDNHCSCRMPQGSVTWRKALSSLFCIHEITDACDWLVLHVFDKICFHSHPESMTNFVPLISLPWLLGMDDCSISRWHD